MVDVRRSSIKLRWSATLLEKRTIGVPITVLISLWILKTLSILKAVSSLIFPFVKTYSVSTVVGATTVVTSASVAVVVSHDLTHGRHLFNYDRRTPQTIEEPVIVKPIEIERRKPQNKDIIYSIKLLDGKSYTGKLMGKKGTSTLIRDEKGVLHEVENSDIWTIESLK